MECVTHGLHGFEGLVLELLERGLLVPVELVIVLRVWDDAVE